MNIATDPVDERQGAMLIDFAVRSGTANIYTEQSNDRAAYVGNKHFVTLLLESEQVHTCGEAMTAVYLHCEYPLRVTYYDIKAKQVRQHEVQQAWVYDSPISNLVLNNTSNKNAVVLCYV